MIQLFDDIGKTSSIWFWVTIEYSKVFNNTYYNQNKEYKKKKNSLIGNMNIIKTTLIKIINIKILQF